MTRNTESNKYEYNEHGCKKENNTKNRPIDSTSLSIEQVY